MKSNSQNTLTGAHNWGQPRKEQPSSYPAKDVDRYVKAALSNIDDLPVHRDPEELPEPIASWRALVSSWLGLDEVSGKLMVYDIYGHNQ